MAGSASLIAAVNVVGPGVLAVACRNGEAASIDLTAWIEEGGAILQALRDHDVFVRAAIGGYGTNVTWDGDDGDLAIDSHHLLRLVDEHRLVHAAA